MASIVFADSTLRYDGRDLERRPLGGTETSVIRCARELARRGHQVTCFTNCDGPVEDNGVGWRPLSSEPPNACDLYIACHQLHLLPFVRRPRRRVLWVLWPANQLRHYKKFWKMWLYRPVPVLVSHYQAKTWSRVLPKPNPLIVLPFGLPEDVRGHPPLATVPPPHAIFASNPAPRPAPAGRDLGVVDPAARSRRHSRCLWRASAEARRRRLGRLGRQLAAAGHAGAGQGVGARASVGQPRGLDRRHARAPA